MSQSHGTPERETLSTELIEFLVEFSVALHRTLMYPAGHPSQEKSADGVVQRLNHLLQERPSISIGVARSQMVIEGVASDQKHPLLRTLAEKFHQQHIGAIVFQRGVSAAEVADMMQLVALRAERREAPLGLGEPERLRQWQGVRLYPLTYDQLELVGGADGDADGDDADRERMARSAQLWLGLARAALTSETRTSLETADAGVIAEAINAHPEGQPYDQMLVGYLLQLTQELKRDTGANSAPIRRRMSQLISKLDPRTLERLVQMGGDQAQRRQFVLDAAEGLSVDAVVEIVRAAGQTSGQNISSSLMRMLSKLSTFAESGPAQLQTQADQALREQVRDLISNWTLDDPNPDQYTQALQHMSTEAAPLGRTAMRYAPEPLRIVQMAVEVDAVGVPLWRAVTELEDAQRISELVDILMAAPLENKTAQQLWQRVGTESSIRSLLGQSNINFDVINALLDRLPTDRAIDILLHTLTESEDRHTRMAAYRRLVATGESAVSRIIALLHDERWYVQRNMLAMLNEMQHVPTQFSPGNFARHTDVRVRREAIALWLRMPTELEQAIVAALKDSDERILRLGVAAAQRTTPESAVPLISTRIVQEQLPADIRIRLIRVLGNVRNPLAVDALGKLIIGGRSFFGLGGIKLAEKTPFMLVALTTLANGWQRDARARAMLERAQRSKDPEIRAAAQLPGKS